MDGTVIAALIAGPLSFAGGIVAVVLTQRGSKKRDHESDWRKLKLEQYKEYVAALSGTVHHPYDSDVQRRYTDAVNSMGLVASTNVLIALYNFLDETSFCNTRRTPQQYDALLSSLMRAMREDSHPEPPNDSTEFIFRTLNCPPEKDSAAMANATRSEREI